MCPVSKISKNAVSLHACTRAILLNESQGDGRKGLMSGELQYIGRRGRGVHGKGGGEDDLPTLPTMAGSYSSTI